MNEWKQREREKASKKEYKRKKMRQNEWVETERGKGEIF